MDKNDNLEETRRLMGALGRMPPKHHSEMKLGKRRGKGTKSPSARKPKSQGKKFPPRTMLLED
jgi:hypothetical protein